VSTPAFVPLTPKSERPLLSFPATSPPRPDPTRSIILLAVAGFASQAQVRVMDSLLPQVAADLHTTVGIAAVVVTAYAVTHGSIQLIIGPDQRPLRQIPDRSAHLRRGRRPGRNLRNGLDLAAARIGASCHRRSRRLGDPDFDGLCRRRHAA